MSRTQIKHRRQYHEKEIDRLMSRGYAGSEDPRFIAACQQVATHEKELKALAAATKEINDKLRISRNEKRLQRLDDERNLYNEKRTC